MASDLKKCSVSLRYKLGLPNGYALRHDCQMVSDVHVSTYPHLNINNMDIIYHKQCKLYKILRQISFRQIKCFLWYHSLSKTIIAVYVIISAEAVLSQSSGGILSSLQPIISSLFSTTTTSNTSVDVGWSDCHLSTIGWIQARLCPGCTETKPCSKSFYSINASQPFHFKKP